MIVTICPKNMMNVIYIYAKPPLHRRSSTGHRALAQTRHMPALICGLFITSLAKRVYKTVLNDM